MEILKFLGWVVIGMLALFIFVACILHAYERRIVPNKYVWLELLNHTKWKTTLQLKKEMETLKGTSWGGMTVYSDLTELEEEGLVVHRKTQPRNFDGQIFTTFEYRLTSSGSRKKVHSTVVQNEREDLRMQPI